MRRFKASSVVRKFKKALKQHRTREGIAATFVAITHNWGFKAWQDKWKANRVMQDQARAHARGLAPEVASGIITFKTRTIWERLDGTKEVHVRRWFGYVTERVPMTYTQWFHRNVEREPSDDETFGPGEWTYEGSEEQWFNNACEHLKEEDAFIELENIMEDTGLWFDDLHADNIGVYPDGRMSIIDCGNE